MDNRLNRYHGRRRLPDTQLNTDLPELARAIAASIRGEAKTQIHKPKGARFVRIISSRGPDVAIRWQDWVKIYPLLEDGTFSPQLFPLEAGFKSFDPVTRFDTSVQESQDPLFRRVLFYLSELFPEQVPT